MNEKIFSRRKAIASMTAGGAGLALASLIGNDTARANEGRKEMMEGQTAASAEVARAFRGQHQPKPLPFDSAKLKGISEKLIK